MDLLSEAPSCDPEVQADVLRARELISPAYPTLGVTVGYEPRPAPLAAPLAAPSTVDCSPTRYSYGEHSQGGETDPFPTIYNLLGESWYTGDGMCRLGFC